MILSDADIFKIITNRPGKKLLDAAQIYTRKLLMHVKGLRLDQYIERIMAFERPDLIAIRKKYAVSNKAMFSRINRPTDKVFSAKGGSVYFNAGDVPTDKLKQKTANIVDGFTLKNWLKTYWMPAMAYDPMGVIMMEIDEDGDPYPTYKSVMDIFEYKLKGRNLEYIIFKLPNKNLDLNTNQQNSEPNPQNKGDQKLLDAVASGAGSPYELYRVVDDLFDRIIKVTSTDIVDVPNELYANPWGTVPASIISSIFDPVLGMYISSEDAIIDLADQFLREGSVVNIVKNYHGFPKAWQYASDCPECAGTGQLNGSQCDYCKGTGVKSRSNPEETINIPVPTDTSQPKIAPEVAGYITPPIESIKMLMDELESLEDTMFETKWGTHMADDTKKGGSETATGKFIDVQPINDKLNEYSDAAEMMETFITDKVGQIIIGQSYQGASVSYGRRYLMETPDTLWNKLRDSTPFAVPEAGLDDIYDDYLQARYSSNAMELLRMQKFALIEPMPWIKVGDVARMATLPDILIREKIWFSKWKKRISPPEVIVKTAEQLQDEFDAFCLEQDTQLNAAIEKNPNINEIATPPTPPEPPVAGAPQPSKQKQAA